MQNLCRVVGSQGSRANPGFVPSLSCLTRLLSPDVNICIHSGFKAAVISFHSMGIGKAKQVC